MVVRLLFEKHLSGKDMIYVSAMRFGFEINYRSFMKMIKSPSKSIILCMQQEPWIYGSVIRLTSERF